jgi:3-methyladenine DNA glycosylase AlkD
MKNKPVNKPVDRQSRRTQAGVTARVLLGRLQAMGNPSDAAILQGFFKTGPGEYGEGDVFLGVRVPSIRRMVREARGGVRLPAARSLLRSRYHEARMLALMLLVELYRRGSAVERQRIVDLYLGSADRINNWDLVDLSAHLILGPHLADRDRSPLDRLARSGLLWERRIAVLATFHFIRLGQFDDTLRLAQRLLGDREDLMHKAVGWMLREVGKRDRARLEAFLDRHAHAMPRTMLRYAIERFPEPLRRAYLDTGRRVRAAR